MTVGFLVCFTGGTSRPGVEVDAWTSIFVVDTKNKLFDCGNILLLRISVAGHGWLLPSERCLVSGRVGGWRILAGSAVDYLDIAFGKPPQLVHNLCIANILLCRDLVETMAPVSVVLQQISTFDLDTLSSDQ
jgi:hypothetical protein